MDLPRTESRRINHGIIQNKFHQNKISYSYLVCYKLQSLFGVMSSMCPGSHLVREELLPCFAKGFYDSNVISNKLGAFLEDNAYIHS